MTAMSRRATASWSRPAATRARMGEVLQVFRPRKIARWFPGVNLIKRHQRQTQRQQGGIIIKEAPIHLSNIAHVDPKAGRPTRMGFKTLETAARCAFAKKSGEVIDV